MIRLLLTLLQSFSPVFEIVYVANGPVFPFVQTSPFFIKTLSISYELPLIIIVHEILLSLMKALYYLLSNFIHFVAFLLVNNVNIKIFIGTIKLSQ